MKTLNARTCIPILRSFDTGKATEFYVDFLGFTIDWQHRFEDGLPLYMQVSRDQCLLHISEHFGDASPGSHVRIEIDDVVAYCAYLNAKKYGNARPGQNLMPWGTIDMTISDPFGNRVTFFSRP
jgi:uncharacterized glyoxalase superfamily protein PhnB